MIRCNSIIHDNFRFCTIFFQIDRFLFLHYNKGDERMDAMKSNEQSCLPQMLSAWYEKNARDLPWRQDAVPYHVWLSEIMLQQTRVEAVKGYYTRFLTALPTVQSLAAADTELVNKLWEGLGYYSRAKNLHRTAKIVVEQYGGVFPRDYSAIRALPGIGDYTAGAICSICFDLPTPAVDGNVLRVMARLTADERCVALPNVKRDIHHALQKIYPSTGCGRFTQSLMELGATVCIPNGTPNCEACPAATLCRSQEGELWRKLPVLPEKRARRVEEKTVFLLRCNGHIAVCKRPDTGLLAGLWQLPECEGTLSEAQAMQALTRWGIVPRALLSQRKRTHTFTHVQWHMTGYEVECRECGGQFQWVSRNELAGGYSMPTAYRQFLIQEDEV